MFSVDVVLLSSCCRAGRAACLAAVVLLSCWPCCVSCCVSCCCRAAVVLVVLRAVLLSCCCRSAVVLVVLLACALLKLSRCLCSAFSHPHLEDIPSVSVKALTFDMVLKLQKPLILGGMKSALGHLEKGCSEYFVNVKKQCATEKKRASS